VEQIIVELREFKIAQIKAHVVFIGDVITKMQTWGGVI
jgi:hypothetical protein